MVSITKEFLEEALREEVVSFQLNSGSNLGDGHTGLLTAVEVTLKSNKIIHILVKCFPLHPTRQEFSMKSNIFYKEVKVYDTLIPALIQVGIKSGQSELPFAKFFHGCAVNYFPLCGGDSPHRCLDPLENYVIMEDLRKTGNYRMANRLEPFDLPHCRLVFTALAQLHGLSWALKSVDKMNSLTDKFPFLGDSFFRRIDCQMFNPIFDNGRDLFLGAVKGSQLELLEKTELSKSIERGRENCLDLIRLYQTGGGKGLSHNLTKDNILRVPGKVVLDEVPWDVAVHQDVHVNNMLFRYDDNMEGHPVQVKLVDLQGVTVGDPMTDLCKFIFNSTTSSFRKSHMDSLLTLYWETFVGICEALGTETPPGFTMDEIHRRFHRCKAFGFMTSLMGLPFILNETNDAADLDGNDKVKNFEELTKEMANSTKKVKSSSIFSIRTVDLVQDLFNEGVI